LKNNISAGILLFRIGNRAEVLLVHPGGPYFKNKDEGSWSVPKGLVEEGEVLQDAARREFEEELGLPLTAQRLWPLDPIKQKSGKMVYAWAAEGDLNTTLVKSNVFKMEYPYKSGKWIAVPEIDRAEWLDLSTARRKINAAQATFIDQLMTILKNEGKIKAE